MNAPVNLSVPVSVAVLDPVARFNLRIAPGDLDRAAQVFGVGLPARIGQGAVQGERAAWCLGPDEWLLHAPEAQTDRIVADFDAARAETPHSLTVLSDREITIAIQGEKAAELLSIACPLDLSRMAQGSAKRTVFDVAQVVLIRDTSDRFRMEVWRSFFPHVHALLQIASREFAIGL